MITITIDKRRTRVQDGTTILEAARRLDIDIPTLCHLEGSEPFTSCMVCLVREMKSDRFVPACSAPAEKGMVVDTGSETVRGARRDVLDLLLREHGGDCESPCTRACPLSLDISTTLRQIARGVSDRSDRMYRGAVPLLGSVERICPAPCERACRRKLYDESLSIRLAIRWAAEHDRVSGGFPSRAVPPSSGRRVAVVGAGPAGLSAAFHLTLLGHACTVYDSRSEPGGALRAGIPEERLPPSVLDDDIARIRDLGVSFRMNRSLGTDMKIGHLSSRFDAVVVATGLSDSPPTDNLGIPMARSEAARARDPFATSREGVFLIGSAARPLRMAARAVAHGRLVSVSIHRYLRGERDGGPEKTFDLHMGPLHEGELDEFLKTASRAPRTIPAEGAGEGFTYHEAAAESKRCLLCGCSARDSCLLRYYAGEYANTGRRFRGTGRLHYMRKEDHPLVHYEPSKCIKCGKCVRIAEKAKESYGLAFNGRSYGIQVSVPLGWNLAKGLERSALQCAEACPTGALTARSGTSKDERGKP